LLVPALSLFAEAMACRNVQVLAVPAASPPVVTVIVAADAAPLHSTNPMAAQSGRREFRNADFMTTLPDMDRRAAF
jgi:hypothetical protein